MAKSILMFVVGAALVIIGFCADFLVPAIRELGRYENRLAGHVIFTVVGLPGLIMMLIGYGGILQSGKKKRHDERRRQRELTKSLEPHGNETENPSVDEAHTTKTP